MSDNMPEYMNQSSENFELSAHVESLLAQLQGMTAELQASGTNAEIDKHFQLAVDACQLSRQIRFRLGNLWKLSGNVRDKITSVFGDCADSINTNLSFDQARQQHVDHARNNIRIRISHIEDPDLVERELLELSGN